MDHLSDDAKALASKHLATMRPGIGTIAFATPYRISRRAKLALDELVRARILTVGPFGEGGLIYRLVSDCSALADWLARNPDSGKFAMVDDEDPSRASGYANLHEAMTLSGLLDEYADRVPPDIMGAAVTELLALGDEETREENAGLGIDGHSLLAFLDFLVMSLADDVPSLGLTLDGMLMGAWATEKGIMTATFAARIAWTFRTRGEVLDGLDDVSDFAQLAERLLPRIRD